jgi:hypothetical protein
MATSWGSLIPPTKHRAWRAQNHHNLGLSSHNLVTYVFVPDHEACQEAVLQKLASENAVNSALF